MLGPSFLPFCYPLVVVVYLDPLVHPLVVEVYLDHQLLAAVGIFHNDDKQIFSFQRRL